MEKDTFVGTQKPQVVRLSVACGMCGKPLYMKERLAYCAGCGEEMIDCTCDHQGRLIRLPR